jgi:hypothetical protein
MLDQLPIIVQPSTRPHHHPARSTAPWCFACRWALGHGLAPRGTLPTFRRFGTAEIVKFEVGDHLRNRR